MKHHNSRGEQRSSVSRSEFNALKKQVSEMQKTVPMPAEQRANMEAAMARQARPGEKPDYYRYTRGIADHGDPSSRKDGCVEGPITERCS